MALPSILKNMNLFLNATSYLGQIPEVSIPKLAIKMDGYRGGGMLGEIMVDMGLETIEFEWKPGGFIDAIFDGFGAPTHDAEQLRWVGAYQDDGTGAWKQVEISMRGRHQEIDPGSGKPGDQGGQTVKSICSYYRLDIDGTTKLEIDFAAMIFVVNGVDRYAELRAILG